MVIAMDMPLRNSRDKAATTGTDAAARRRNPVLPVLIVLGVICGLVIGWNLLGKYVIIPAFFKNFPQPVVTVGASAARSVTWTPGIEAVGTAKAVRGVDVAAELGGVVKAINFKSNEFATENQVLVQMDDSVERANLIAAQANIRLYDAQLARAAELRRKGVNAQANLDDARAQLDVAKSNYDSIQATIDKKAISARFSGKLGIARVDVGEYIEPGTVVVTLQDISRIKVDFTVPEQEAGLIEVGRRVRFGETFDDLAFEGSITGIDPKVEPETRLVMVQAEVDNSSGRIQPGQFLRVRVDLPTQEGVIAVPQGAVIPSLYGDYVYVVEKAPADDAAANKKKDDADAKLKLVARQTFVKVGRRSGDMIQIQSGLKAGDEIVTSGQNKLHPGSFLAIDNSVDSAIGNAGGAGDMK